jgi:hypothetical protein
MVSFEPHDPQADSLEEDPMSNLRILISAAVLALVALLAPAAGAAQSSQTAPARTPLKVTYYFIPG